MFLILKKKLTQDVVKYLTMTHTPKLLAIDLDGTLFYPKRKKTLISTKNLKFIREFLALGNKVVLVTSRNQKFAEMTAETIGYPLDLICTNGAQIILNGKLIQDIYFAKHEALKVYEELSAIMTPLSWFLDTNKYRNMMYINTNSKPLQKFFEYYYKFQGIYREDYYADKELFLKELKEGHVYRLLMYFGIRKKNHKKARLLNKFIRDNYPDLESSWIGSMIELAPRQINKGNSLKYLINQINFNPENVYVAGDSGNDISMFKAFQNSFVMKHASIYVKKHAKNRIRYISDLRKILLDKEE